MEVRNLTADAEEFTSNAYLVIGRAPALVDVGTVSGIAESVADHVDSLAAVFITHQHGDHIGALGEVIDRFDPTVYAYADHANRTASLSDGDTVTIGDVECETIYTPGHAADHLVFVGSGTLFSGDVVVYEDGAFSDGSFGRTDRPGQSRERLIESIETILERTDDSLDELYPGHGPAYQGEIRDVIERALERAGRREPKYGE